jgi:dihydroxyacetone kinase
VVGEIFTSPSAEDVYQCIKAVDGGAGVLMSFGNYSGDVMHFGLAAQRARREGIDVRIVVVTDDVVSAPVEQSAARRGVAGGFFVFRAASAAAHAGCALDDVEQAALLANAATATFGVAFDGCTFPAASEPLFQVEPEHMAVGLGIHGEPGIDVVPWMPADEVADLMLRPLLEERPAGAVRARLLLNGLGATKYEELFVLYRGIARGLANTGIEVVAPEVGEYVTSLNMAGCSLTLCWLSDELESLLSAPVWSPAYRSDQPEVAMSLGGSGHIPPRSGEIPSASYGSPQTGPARTAAEMIGAMADVIDAARDELGALDSVAGDGDHGVGMSRGMRAAAASANVAGPGVSNVLDAAGLAFAQAAGGASGALWGAALSAAGHELIGLDTPGTAEVAHALRASLTAMTDLGGAKVGDKTLIDAVVPFVETFERASSEPIAKAWSLAAQAASAAADRTASMVSSRGRSAVHGEHSRGTRDPGAHSFALAVQAAARVLIKESA